MRVFGDLMPYKRLSGRHQQGFVQEVKRVCNLSLAISNRPQDARLELRGMGLAIRASSLPALGGEKIVLRLLDTTLKFDLEATGLGNKSIMDLKDAVKEENGLILIVGATGSGKSRTLFSLLSELDWTKRNIVTLENPIEYSFTGITQIEVSKTLSFADGLRAVLRQDPDVILVGEIRDFETADLCFKAAATGHLVLSTLHANGPREAIKRLQNIGVEPYMIESNLRFVASQRLIKKIKQGNIVGRRPVMEYLSKEQLKTFGGER